MHDTAKYYGKRFFETYVNSIEIACDTKIVDIGSQDVNGSLREFAPSESKYIGVDFAAGRGVDVILTNPYELPFEDNSVGFCVSSSCFEHSEFFWLLFLEIVRILRPGGLVYLNAPSNGPFHRYPVDSWRFYPDAGLALQNWARHNKQSVLLLESFVANRQKDVWNDFVAVFIKDESKKGRYKERIIDSEQTFVNGLRDGSKECVRYSKATEAYRTDSMCTKMRHVLREAVSYVRR